ncbi:sugar-binding transcriptional regulator [Tsukamurella sp. 1534]|uniref:sugar-binding transcriptional regulator n=1 Tax=Tsukamurella sp. 1534 TaxID=1151061 RepID=UPI0002D80DC7|nr:sugar-binding domain-containing protein [Tsukamurella sp. 1534]
MESHPWSDDELRRVATLYYYGDETMETIAAGAGVSRSTVSRQLNLARRRGIVRIDIRSGDGTGGLSAELAKRFGIEAHVVPVRETATDSHRLTQVARSAGRLLSDWFDDDTVMGVAWGTTVSSVMEHLVPKRTRGGTVVQLNGAVHAASAEVRYVSDLLGRACDAFDARPVFFPVPAFFDDPATKAALWRERSIASVVDLQQRCDFVVFGVGSWWGQLTSQVYAGGYLDAEDITALKHAGVVGDVCTTFVRGDGSWADLRINERTSGPDLGRLALVPRRLCVVASSSRIPGTLGALGAGAISHLVIDEQTATELLRAGAPRARPRQRRVRR